MANSKLFIVPVMGMTFDLSEPNTVFYVYEIDSKDLLIQKHVRINDGIPLLSREESKWWVKKKMALGKLIPNE